MIPCTRFTRPALVLGLFLLASWGTFAEPPAVRPLPKKPSPPPPARPPKKEEPVNAQKPMVRKLPLILNAAELAPLAPGEMNVSVATSVEEMTRIWGEKIARQIAANVAFPKDKVVRVDWFNEGPPYSTLEPRLVQKKDGYRLEFQQRKPQGPGPGQFPRSEREFFIVTATVEVAAETEKAKAAQVRKLQVAVDQTDLVQQKPGVSLAASNEEMTRAWGEKFAQQISKQVDFKKEKVVRVDWGSEGPPFDTLEYRFEKNQAKMRVEFFQRKPQAQARGQAYMIGLDFYAVPIDAEVSFVVK